MGINPGVRLLAAAATFAISTVAAGAFAPVPAAAAPPIGPRRPTAPDPEQVVHVLERQPEPGTEVAEARHLFPAAAAEQRAQRGGAAQRRAGLGLRHPLALRQAHIGTPLERHVDALPATSSTTAALSVRTP